MPDHVTVTVGDFKRSLLFDDKTLAPLGMTRLHADGNNIAAVKR